MIPAASLVDFDALWKIVVAGFAGGAGVVLAFGLVLGAMVCAAALIAGFIALTKK